jgi:hypothetical protein
VMSGPSERNGRLCRTRPRSACARIPPAESAMKRQVASSRMTFGSIDDWNLRSNGQDDQMIEPGPNHGGRPQLDGFKPPIV